MTRKPIAGCIMDAWPARPSQSSIIDLWKCFWPLDRLVEALQAGEVCYGGATPVMLDHDGQYGEIIPSLAGFCSTLERMARAIRIPLDLGHMLRVAKRLEIGVLLEVSDIDRFAALVDRCRAIFLACPAWIRHRAYLDECIGMAIADLGLREAA